LRLLQLRGSVVIEEKNCPGCFKLYGRRIPIAAWLSDCPWCGHKFVIAPQVHRKPKPPVVSGELADGTKWKNLSLL
jgi:hypothetical protein